ncbi:hypothetical protein K2173_011676 [Erythroxylum novogranatense]|uniref:Uncharacterized protein n=1 Tax=Erythroxylum novogranatense TaxID=1862640 RepID=A0AAV8T1L1_9ROSI|nr:hypothetical protein K2173_011676 [Erythroxylum novogranatense]
MAMIQATPYLHLTTTTTTPFYSSRVTFPPQKPKLSFTVRASTDEVDDPNESTEPEPEPAAAEADENSFDSRLSRMRLKYRSGTGKKAELRKSRKGTSKSKSGASLYLPPVPLKEAVSGGLKVEFGFNPYSERLNGRIAILGLAALLLVELATGKSLINYHTPAIVLIQAYFVAAVTALFVKYEKEKISIWPQFKE